MRTRKTRMSIGGLYGGISQQAPELRLPNQLDDAKNIKSSPIEQLQLGRWSTKVLKKLTALTAGSTQAYISKLTSSYGTYILVGLASATTPLVVLDLNGNEMSLTYKTVGALTPKTYANYGAQAPYVKLRSRSMLDKTFLINKAYPVAKATTRSTAKVQECFCAVWIKRDQYEVTTAEAGGTLNHTYKLKLIYDDPHNEKTGEISVDHTTTQEGTEAIANALAAKISAALIAASLETIIAVSSNQSVVTVRHVSPNDTPAMTLRLEASDTFGNTLMQVINSEAIDTKTQTVTIGDVSYPKNFVGVVARKELLFPIASSDMKDMVLKVTGDNTRSSVGYYLVYDSVTGVYKESIGPYQELYVLAQSMPIEILATSATTFDVQFFGYDALEPTASLMAPRKVGDYDSNPFPTFVGQTINDMFLFRNRLGFLSGDSVCLSKTSEFYDFFATTATDVLDNDPIDITAGTTDYTELLDAVMFEDEVHIFDSTSHQFLLHSGGAALNPTTVQLEPATQYQRNPTIPPANIGTSILFMEAPGADGYSHLREYIMNPDGVTKEANRLTTHVPRLLVTPNYSHLLPMTTSNIVFIRPPNADKMFVFEYLVTTNEEGFKQYAQQAWNVWDFSKAGMSLLGAIEHQDTVYLIVAQGVSAYLCELKKDDSSLFRLDFWQKTTGAGVYNSGTGRTSFTLPIAGDLGVGALGNFKVYLWSSKKQLPDSEVLPVVTGTTLTLLGDWSAAGDMLIGAPMESYAVLSPLRVKDGEGNIVSHSGVHRATKVDVGYRDTGHLQLTSEDTRHKQTRVMTFRAGSRLGRAVADIATPLVLESSERKPLSYRPLVDVRELKITLGNDESQWPATVTGLTIDMEVTQW